MYYRHSLVRMAPLEGKVHDGGMRAPFPPYDPASRPNPYSRRCPSNAVLDMVADKWTALIVSRLHDGRKRHGELLGSIDGLSQRMLTQTLRALERNGLLTRTVFPVVPPHVEYELTPLGQSLYQGALNPLTRWAMNNMGEVVQARREFEAREDGQAG
jgi:DNA-binding HxlR family transcriptional regulator